VIRWRSVSAGEPVPLRRSGQSGHVRGRGLRLGHRRAVGEGVTRLDCRLRTTVGTVRWGPTESEASEVNQCIDQQVLGA
jgi:hypothetical protein